MTPLGELLEVFLKVCDAIFYAHTRGVIHRDLKPSNLMIGPFGEVYVMDWGIAKVLEFEDDELDQEGAVIGTLTHISPEQTRGEMKILGPASDQYNLGLILFELVTLQRAMPDGTIEDMYRRARRGQIRPIQHSSSKIPIRRELKAIITKATKNKISEK